MATFAISDIHGNWNKFQAMLKKIEFKNTDDLFILGDVIDKNPNGIKILKFIIDKKNIHFIPGNHEEDLFDMINLSKKGKRHNGFDSWIKDEGADTSKDFFALSKKEQDDIINFIGNSPITKIIEVDEKVFHLSHMMPPEKSINNNEDKDRIENRTKVRALTLKEAKELLGFDKFFTTDWNIFQDIDDLESLGNILHARINQGIDFVLVGHRPVNMTRFGKVNKNGNSRITKMPLGNVIDLDCACGHNGLLGCLRLDDMETFHID